MPERETPIEVMYSQVFGLELTEEQCQSRDQRENSGDVLIATLRLRKDFGKKTNVQGVSHQVAGQKAGTGLTQDNCKSWCKGRE